MALPKMTPPDLPYPHNGTPPAPLIIKLPIPEGTGTRLQEAAKAADMTPEALASQLVARGLYTARTNEMDDAIYDMGLTLEFVSKRLEDLTQFTDRLAQSIAVMLHTFLTSTGVAPGLSEELIDELLGEQRGEV